MTTPDDIIKYARTWTGAVWRHQGRGKGPKRGIDCAGLLLVVAHKFGLPHGDLRGYRREPGQQFVDNINNHSLHFTNPIPGAIGIFSDTIQPCHCGIFAERNGVLTVIHSESYPKGLVHEEIYDTGYECLAKRLVGVRLYKDVDYGQ